MISWRVEHSSKRLRGKGGEENIITFFDMDLVRVYNTNNDTAIMSMMIAKYDIKIILVDSGNLVDVLFYDTFI